MTLRWPTPSRQSVLRRSAWATFLALILALPVFALPGAASNEGGRAKELAALPADRTLDLGYHVYAGGLQVFSVDARVGLRPESYAVALRLQTDGWLGWFLTFSLDSRTTGRANPEGLAPERFRTDSLWEDKERSVEVSYRGEGLPHVVAVPPAEEDDREIVPDELRAGTVDPLSAALGLVHELANGGRCGGEATIFDGRRRFDASTSHIGPAQLEPSDIAPFGGPATACRLTVQPVVGFWKTQDYRIEPKNVTVFFRRLTEGGLPVPVRVEADSLFGAVRIHLVSAGPAD